MLCPQNTEHTISLQEHPELLALLRDEDFRQQLKNRPVEVLGRFGVSLRPEDLPSSVEVPEADPLPSPKVSELWLGLYR